MELKDQGSRDEELKTARQESLGQRVVKLVEVLAALDADRECALDALEFACSRARHHDPRVWRRLHPSHR